MRNLLLFTALILGIAAFVPRLYLDASSRTAITAPAVPEASPSGRSLTLRKGDGGHFHTEATLDGRRMSFLVDTGASVIALRAKDAARLGVRPSRQEFTARVSTANGAVMAAPTEIRRVDLGGIVVHNVAALVLPDEALSENLLGMSFLSRVRFEHTKGRLVIEQ